MVVRPKDAVKLLGIVIMCACASLVCTLFLNSNMDMVRIKDQITDKDAMKLYELTVSSGNMTAAVTGGALGLTSLVMLFFYVKHYIDAHGSELGVLKALGYSNWKIARGFWVFGLSVFVGTAIGFCAAFAFMPKFYGEMRSGMGFETPIHFNPVLPLYLCVTPTLAFALMAMAYGYRKLKRPVLELIRGRGTGKTRKVRLGGAQDALGTPFLAELRKVTVRSRLSLIFFIGFAAFCYASTVVMSFSVGEMGASDMMAVMMAGIGFVLAVTTLYIAVTTVVRGNVKTIAMLRVFGYSNKECSDTILNGYRPVTYIGFALGTAYQYGLMKMMMFLFFDDEVMEVPDYGFDVPAFLIALVSFLLLYECFMQVCAARMKRIPVKEIMQEE